MADEERSGILVDLRAERATLQAIVEAMEARQLGIGMPVTIPGSVSPAAASDIEDRKRKIGELDILIADYESRGSGTITE